MENQTKGSECIIHSGKESPDSKLISPRDLSSWKSLVSAARIRNHRPVLDLADKTPEDEIPKIFYHRDCRSIFTLKRDLDNIAAKTYLSEKEETEAGPSGVRHSQREAAVSSSEASRVYSPICIFCMKSSKYKKGSNTREPLVKCTELRSDERIRNIAVEKNDSRILALVSRELVAAEGHYHRFCYREYTRQQKPDPETSENIPDSELMYINSEQAAYEDLYQYIREEVFENPQVVKLTSLRDRVIAHMKQRGTDVIKDSTKTHVYRKVRAEFGDSLHFINDQKSRVLVFPDNLTMEALVLENQELKERIQEISSKICDTDNDHSRVALALRKDIKEHSTDIPWPPLPLDLRDAASYIPNCLSRFLELVLTGKKQDIQLSDKVKRVVESVGQDIVYGVSLGKQKTVKHILLPFAVKSLTGCVELIKILNRLGHGISYSQVEEIDTALCLNKLSENEDTVALPDCIKPYVATSLGWDNIDRLEETLTGGETSHRVNGIAVQQKIFGPSLPRESLSIQRSKQRTVTPSVKSIPEYNAGERVGPLPRKYLAIDAHNIRNESYKKNLLWMLARLHCSSNQIISSWTGFNILVRDKVEILQDIVGYLPTINSPATELKSVHEVLKQSLKIMHALQLKSIVVVFDQALYAKATEILWKHPETFKNIIPRLGVFHTICTLLGIIGKRFQDAGLRDLCIESGVLAEGSVMGVLEGRKYNRAVRFHKLLYEALMRQAWKGFLVWIDLNNEEKRQKIYNLNIDIDEMCENICQENFSEVFVSKDFSDISVQFGQYLEQLRNCTGDLASFWMSYIDMVEIMLDLLRASREGNWHLHLFSIHSLIPWCFSYDNINYARYLSAYYAEMSNLPTEHPEVYEYLQNGGFSVQLGSSNTFGKLPVDQTVEETVNKDTQTQGGTKGFSLNAGAVSRYYLTAEYRSSYLRMLKDMLDLSDPNTHHTDLSKARITRDESDIQKLIDMLENNWIDPFNNEDQELISISTGTLAPPDVLKDLKSAYETGTKAYESFRKERMEPPIVKKFHDSLTKQRLKTFTSIVKKKVCKTSNQNTILKADRNLFAQMIIIAQTRDLNMKEVLSHPLGPLPWALATSDGSMRKTSKSSLTKELVKTVKAVESFPERKACIIDGMALLQKIRGSHKTFADLSEHILSLVMAEGKSCDRIDVVFDVYKQGSIKDAERVRRGSSDGTQFKNIAPGHSVQQWRKFLSGSENKKNLIQFLAKEWKQPKNSNRFRSKQFFVTCEEECFVITENGFQVVDELKSTQEEADTRILLHASHAANSGFEAVIISSDDTDVTVLCVAFSKVIQCQIFQKSGTQSRTKYVDIGKIAAAVGPDVCEALPGLHAFTGCDTVSAFAGRGKVSALKILKSSKTYQDIFRMLGTQWDLTTELLEGLQAFTCALYSTRSSTSDINELRYMLFCARKGDIESWQLPPCAASLVKHCMRANYQCGIWRRCLECCPDVPCPVGNGWCLDDEDNTECLAVEWNDVSPAPDAVLELLSCNCSRSCDVQTCPCLKNKLKCTQMCRLQFCTNQKAEETFSSCDESSDESDDEWD